MGVLGRFIFWDYARGSWQYDVMVAIIVAFIFGTPLVAPDFFHDQPKGLSVSNIGDHQFWIVPELLSGVPEAQRVARATQLVKDKYKTARAIKSVEQVTGDEHEIQGYLATTQP